MPDIKRGELLLVNGLSFGLVEPGVSPANEVFEALLRHRPFSVSRTAAYHGRSRSEAHSPRSSFARDAKASLACRRPEYAKDRFGSFRHVRLLGSSSREAPVVPSERRRRDVRGCGAQPPGSPGRRELTRRPRGRQLEKWKNARNAGPA